MPDFEKLIEDLKKDIEDVGNIDMYALFKTVNGQLLLVDYLFIISDTPSDYQEFTEGTTAVIMKAESILKILELEKDMF